MKHERSARDDASLWMYIAAGALSGLRAGSAPAAVAERLQHYGRLPADTPAAWLDARSVRIALRMLASLEMAADKLPGAMRRTRWPALVGRIGSGAISGAALSSADRRGWLLGATLGAAAAAIATHLSYKLRKHLATTRHIPDGWIGVAEDALVLAGSQALMRA